MDNQLRQISEKKHQLDTLKLPGQLGEQLNDWIKVELTYSSNAIEGNSLTRLETAEIVEKGLYSAIAGKPLKDQLEAINHAKALELVASLTDKLKSHQFITEEHIKAVHKIILNGIDDAWAGRYRKTEVFIRGTSLVLPKPKEIPSLMRRFINWLSFQQEQHPVMIATLVHLKFVTIHPFIDGNGRVGRLLMNLILQLGGYPPAIIKQEEKSRYLETLNLAQTKSNLEPFSLLVQEAVERSLDAYLNAAQEKPILATFIKTQGKLLKIGELAQLTNEPVPTIRFWTKEGLLRVSKYTKSGYQLYDHATIEQIQKIRALQNQRFTLAEIKKQLLL